MKVFIIDTKKRKSYISEIKDELEDYYRVIGCRLIDIQSRAIDGVYYDFICDDEGLFTEKAIVSAVSQDGKPQLVGSIIICKYDETTGGEKGLEDEDIKRISDRLAIATSPDGERFSVVVIDNLEE